MAEVPAAYVGGTVDLPPQVYRPLVGIFLLIAALRLFSQPRDRLLQSLAFVLLIAGFKLLFE
ncbi:MAG TPA: hypothetical protein VFK58_01470 [Sphingomicrobium sp.]|nr:hypothetical protein [Sphingomicrobium sp.]